MLRKLLILCSFSFLALAAGCSGDTEPSTTSSCTPGESVRCACTVGDGAQVCQDDGTFGPCECAENVAVNGSTNNNQASNSSMNSGSTNNASVNNGSTNNASTNNSSSSNNAATNNSSSSNNASTNNATTSGMNNETTGPRFCTQTCNVAGDCAAFGDAANWECNGGYCDLRPCTTDEGCVIQMSNWAPGCQSDNQCDFGFVCIEHDGTNYCAIQPVEGFLGCDEFQMDTLMKTHVQDGMMVSVCGVSTAMCEQSSGFCYRECATDSDCRPGDDQVGLVCNPQTNQCECEVDANCTISGDKCYEGECGCSNQRVCDRITAMSGVSFECH